MIKKEDWRVGFEDVFLSLLEKKMLVDYVTKRGFLAKTGLMVMRRDRKKDVEEMVRMV